jgi:hypothetical protein
LNVLVSIHLKVATGYVTGTHAREKYFKTKKIGKTITKKIIFVLLASSKDIEPQEPTTLKEWETALMSSQAIIDGIDYSDSIQISSFSKRASSNCLGPVDRNISKLRSLIKPTAPQRPVTPKMTSRFD